MPACWNSQRCKSMPCKRSLRHIVREVQEELPTPPDVEQDTQGYQLPSDVIARLRETVFGFDTFFVTKTENYQADGVLFKGNLRGDPKESYARMQRRCQVPPPSRAF